jgi:hypothetical protein
MVRTAAMRQAGVMADLPTPVRAAIGFAATALDEVRHLPDKAIELPMLAVSTALQMSLRAQQRYAALTARGDAVLAGRLTSDDAPPWATFDPTPVDPAAPVPAASASGTEATDIRADGDAARGRLPADDAAPAGDTVSTVDAATWAPPDDLTEVQPPRPGAARPHKTVRRPRNAAPSAFDAVGDDEG